MRSLFFACVGLTFAATVLACTREANSVDRAVLAACAVVQFALMFLRLPGEVAHVTFIVALSYAALFGGRLTLAFASGLLVLTLALRAVYGGCIFNVTEGNGTLRGRKDWDADAKLSLLLIVALARLWSGACTWSTVQRFAGALCVALYVCCTWEAG